MGTPHRTTRRRFLALGAGVAAGGAFTACRAPGGGPAPAAAEPADLLLADTGAGLVLLRGSARLAVGPAVATPDARTVYSTLAGAGPRTRLTTVETASGRQDTGLALDGAWTPRVAWPGGLVALVPAGAPTGRTRTRIVVADGADARYTLDVAGNVDPEAFTVDGTGLYVLDWLPPTAPDRYRVRVVDLASGASRPLNTRNKVPVSAGAEEEMRGRGRQAVRAPDGNTLYTLYTNQPDPDTPASGGGPGWTGGTPAHAFVHTLNLSGSWAFCVDLPDPFGAGPAAAHTVAIDHAGAKLYVADLHSGRLAVVDTAALGVETVVPIPAAAGTFAGSGSTSAGGTPTGSASAAVSRDDRVLYLAAGRRIHAFALGPDRATTWDTGAEVRGLAVSDGGRLYAGYPGGVAEVDPVTGLVRHRWPVPGLTALRAAA
jgi:YVTN family beta-propeller protein